MSQHDDYSLANQSGASFRSDLNTCLAAVVTWNSGATAPTTMFPRMRWIDTTTGSVKRRNAANSAWIVEGTDRETRVVTRSSNTVLGIGDFGITVLCNGTFVQTLDAAATLGDGWWARVRNDGNGIITLDPNGTETIDGVTTLSLLPRQSGIIVCNGSGFKTIGRIAPFTDTDAVVQGNADPTKRIRFRLDAVSSGTELALTVPNNNFVLVGEAVGQTLTNKFIDADANTISNIDQGNIKTATGEVSASSVTPVHLALPGGTWGFYPNIRADSGTTSLNATIASAWTANTSFFPIIALSSIAGDITRAQQRYISACPPYDLGDGEVPLFVFALVDSLGKIIGTYVAEDPPWANNGPTDIHTDLRDANGRSWQRRVARAVPVDWRNPTARAAEFARLAMPPVLIEVTQTLKQADMPLIPHPFLSDLNGKTVVLLDPVGPQIAALHGLHRSGESVAELLHGDYLTIGNTPLKRKSPPGVMPVTVNWK